MADARNDAVLEALDELRARIAVLEARAGISPAAHVERASAPAPLDSAVGPPSTAPEDLAALPTALAAVEAAAKVEPPPQAQRVSPGETSGALAQIIGAVIGAVIGSMGGLAGTAVGAFLGWLSVVAVQSQNRRAARDALRYRSGKLPDRQPATPIPALAEVSRAPASGERPSAWMQRVLGGNVVAKIGVLVLFCGVGFLLKYAYDHALLPVPVRLAGVALAGLAMLYAGRRLLERRRLYALILQGGGIGLLYLDVYFALKVFGLVDAATGFAAFLILGVAATLLAVRQNAKILAVLGLTGAFLAPILAGSNTGNHVLLFSYYTLLNSFILAISWFRAWRDLNLVGFVFTFAVGVLWAADNYRPEHFATVEPFVLVFFAMYLVIPILFARRQPPNLKGLVDGTLVFGTPLCVAFMQASLVRDMPYGLAWSAGVASVLYALLALMTFRREGMRLLAETYVALSVVFLTLAIFFAFEGYPTFALWTLEGAAIVWVGLRQKRRLARAFGLALQLAGAGYFLMKYPGYDLSNPWWNAFIAGCVIIAAAGFVIARLMHRYRDPLDSPFGPGESLLLAWAAGWWSVAGVHALHHALPGGQFASALLAFAAFSAAAAELAGAGMRWTTLRRAAVLLPAGMLTALFLQLGDYSHPFDAYGFLTWPCAVAILYAVLRRHEEDGIAVLPGAQHVAGLWLAVIVLTVEGGWQLRGAGFGKAWITAVYAAVPAAALGWVTHFSARSSWPFGIHYARFYGLAALAPIAACLGLWMVYANFAEPGSTKPLPYLPLLNPVDLVHVAVFAVLWRWSRTLPALERSKCIAVLAAFGFLWVNCVLLRTVHYWTGVAYHWDALSRSVLVQSGFSLLWTATAFVVMRNAARVGHRRLWMVGAALLGVVVLKLFLNDLSNTGTVARIVSFLGVGAGLLLIGYVAPVPPGDTERQPD